jgi:GNAT superfamily N-acetyltransferase
MLIRPVAAGDFSVWLPLWDAYNAFYGREGVTALPGETTQSTWQRLLDPNEPMHALVAVDAGALVGLAHYLLHPSTSQVAPVCYLQDLFTTPASRGKGVGRSLIEAVAAHAKQLGCARLYWQTHESNVTARRLYDLVAERSGFIVYRKGL